MILRLIREAQNAGARLDAACEVVGISARTVERWRKDPEATDRRCGPLHSPPNALSDAERRKLLELLTAPEHAGVSPKQLVPRLADDGRYLASESTMYRLLRQSGLSGRRRTTPRTHVTRATATHCATAPNQVWSWDITWLPTMVRGEYLYLYLMMDVWSRRIVGWELHDRESAGHASELLQRTVESSGIDPKGLVLHSDNGKPMRGATMVSTLQWLGVIPSFSRPHVSNDNPYSEALFRTLKHTTAYPALPFADQSAARSWVTRFVDWYNGAHHHSGIRYVTPDDRHFGREIAILANRRAVYERARRGHPKRWARQTRTWEPIPAVVLNPRPIDAATV